MGLMDNLMGNLGGAVGGQPEVVGRADRAPSDGVPFPTRFLKDDYDENVGGTVQPGEWAVIAQKRIPAGVNYTWGAGRSDHETTIGTYDVALADSAGAAIQGKSRIQYNSPTGRGQEPVDDKHTTEIAGSENAALPEQVEFAPAEQDDLMQVLFKNTGSAAVTIDHAASTLRIPVTEYDLKVRR